MIHLWTDGSVLKNGDAASPGGAAVVLISKSGDVIHWSKKAIKKLYNTTSNRAELEAVILGFLMVKKPSDVVVHSDSQYVVRCGDGTYSINANHDLWARLFELCKPHTISWEWVRGHKGIYYNEQAHCLAEKAMRDASGIVEG